MNNEVSILENINNPSDIKNLSETELENLCSEIRKTLVDTVASTGGHLASNLGTVELTVALHKSFNSPDDKIVWDVGHQAYAHKLLTGRYPSFSTLRTEGGVSGFVRPDESEHDSFYEGHAGVSVSQAAGIAAANAVKGSKNYAVAVIGDGSFGNGMVYEALNHAGSTKTRLIVILNDNEMSISENVGAMARYLAAVRAKPEYYRFKAGTEKTLRRIPLVGKSLSNHIFKLKTTLKNIIYSSSFFEDLGFKYIGPIDGHNISSLCEAMNSAKMVSVPVVIHINTVKGRGYDFAETAPEKFHGISKFDINTGEPLSSGDSFSVHFGKTLGEFASKDRRICAITAAMALGTGLEEFSKNYSERFYDVGIAEEHAVTFASGLSAGGMIPVFAVYSTFLQRCSDQLIHDGALQRKKMVIAVDRAGFVGEDGETHQGLFDVSLTQSLPNTTVYSPSTYNELSKAMYNAFYKDENLVVIRYPRGSMPDVGDFNNTSGADYEVIGNADADIAIVTYGRLYFNAVKAIHMLYEKGLNVKIIKIHKIKPMPQGVSEEASKCKSIFFFEEGMRSGGTGEALAARLLENGYQGKFSLTAVEDEFVSHASVPKLMEKYSLSAEKMSQKILNEVMR
ncbi:MAG: 1-deoxy-D-xylulose-5-phosphate synthase [Ruminococcaceae bacterium]|nr:1-deoxy-D-xylulose-5-phosphate synthase [Oscillospiraceae bacterium]